MGLFDKLKNVFFEEEVVDGDEKEEETVVREKEKVQVAKKIDVSEVKKKEEEKKEASNKLELDTKDDYQEPVKEHDFKFPMGFDDKDFEVEKTIEIFGPVKEKEEPPVIVEEEPKIESDEPPVEKETRQVEYTYEEVAYKEPIKQEVKQEVEYHKLYEGRERDKDSKPGFTPSPIISPIYGILNKNYKKEQIVTKSERETPQINKKDSLDLVREKAYGDLASEISASIEDDLIDTEEEKPKEKEDLFYDLNEEESPTVKTVTVGDAEEYFTDLGLEYNVDYKVEKEKNKELEIEDEEEKPKTKRVEKLHMDENEENDKNLFDLIDAMYEDEETK